MVLINGLRGILCALLAVGFLGAFHPAGDSFAVLRFPLAIAGLILALWPGGGLMIRLLCGSVSAFALFTVMSVRMGAELPGPVTVYQKNMRFSNADPEAVAEDILQRAPDIVTLQEVTLDHRYVLKHALAGAYPTWLWCPAGYVGGTAVASRWPMIPGTGVCPPGLNVTGVQVRAPGAPVWLVSMHLHWPWPFRQKLHLRGVLPPVARLDGPVVIGGDFNIVPWADAFSLIETRTGLRRVGGVRPTLWKNNVPLPIDHVLAPGGGDMTILPKLGSDHQGVWAHVHLK